MKPNCFLRKERLVQKKDYEAIYKKGVRGKIGSFLQVRILSVPGDQTRLGLSVSKRVGNAVVRNRVKRLLREIFRKNKGLVKKGVDLVLIARPGILEHPYRELEEKFCSYWGKSSSEAR